MGAKAVMGVKGRGQGVTKKWVRWYRYRYRARDNGAWVQMQCWRPRAEEGQTDKEVKAQGAVLPIKYTPWW